MIHLHLKSNTSAQIILSNRVRATPSNIVTYEICLACPVLLNEFRTEIRKNGVTKMSVVTSNLTNDQNFTSFTIAWNSMKKSFMVIQRNPWKHFLLWHDMESPDKMPIRFFGIRTSGYPKEMYSQWIILPSNLEIDFDNLILSSLEPEWVPSAESCSNPFDSIELNSFKCKGRAATMLELILHSEDFQKEILQILRNELKKIVKPKKIVKYIEYREGSFPKETDIKINGDGKKRSIFQETLHFALYFWEGKENVNKTIMESKERNNSNFHP